MGLGVPLSILIGCLGDERYGACKMNWEDITRCFAWYGAEHHGDRWRKAFGRLFPYSIRISFFGFLGFVVCIGGVLGSDCWISSPLLIYFSLSYLDQKADARQTGCFCLLAWLAGRSGFTIVSLGHCYANGFWFLGFWFWMGFFLLRFHFCVLAGKLVIRNEIHTTG